MFVFDSLLHQTCRWPARDRKALASKSVRLEEAVRQISMDTATWQVVSRCCYVTRCIRTRCIAGMKAVSHASIIIEAIAVIRPHDYKTARKLRQVQTDYSQKSPLLLYNIRYRDDVRVTADNFLFVTDERGRNRLVLFCLIYHSPPVQVLSHTIMWFFCITRMQYA